MSLSNVPFLFLFENRILRRLGFSYDRHAGEVEDDEEEDRGLFHVIEKRDYIQPPPFSGAQSAFKRTVLGAERA